VNLISNFDELVFLKINTPSIRKRVLGFVERRT
jgi:hypothetical protein